MLASFVDPGALRHELSLQAVTTAPDGAGGHAETWAELATVFAQIEPVSTRAVFGADQSLETATHRITLRWRGDVASGMRFAKGARAFDIVTVDDPDETGRYLVCRTREPGR